MIILVIIILILLYEINKINYEINTKIEIINYLKEDANQNIKNNLELKDNRYIISDLNNKLKNEIKVNNKLQKLYKRKQMTSKSSSELFQKGNYKPRCKIKRSYSCNDI
jgi:hypothetical protein